MLINPLLNSVAANVDTSCIPIDTSHIPFASECPRLIDEIALDRKGLCVLQLFYKVNRARILKHLLEAEKSTFREEPSFQRSENTIGILQATVCVHDIKDYFL
jgi:hypothetical protein